MLDPHHNRAQEHIGEAYLLAGDVEQAQIHLKHLVRLRPKGCEEREVLRQAIAAVQAKEK